MAGIHERRLGAAMEPPWPRTLLHRTRRHIDVRDRAGPFRLHSPTGYAAVFVPDRPSSDPDADDHGSVRGITGRAAVSAELAPSRGLGGDDHRRSGMVSRIGQVADFTAYIQSAERPGNPVVLHSGPYSR